MPALYTEHCSQTVAGHGYVGTVSVTKSGKQCQKWSSNTPNTVPSKYTDSKFPDGSREAANSYCRNPDLSWTGVWCYTTDPDTNWEECDVPQCSKSSASYKLFVSGITVCAVATSCCNELYL